MTGADYAILMVAGLSLFAGLKRGFVREFFPLMTLAAAAAAAFLSFDVLAGWFAFWWFPRPSHFTLWGYEFSVSAAAGFAFFILVFFAVVFLGGMLSAFLSKFIQTSVISGFDRFFGLLFGALRAALILAVLTLFGSLAGMSDYPWWRQSVLMPTVENTLMHGMQFLPSPYYEKFYRPPSPLEHEGELDV